MREQNMDAELSAKRKKAISTQLLIGLVIVLVGTGLLLRRMDFPLPDWLFGWEMILIIVGVVSGINSKFKDISWIIPIIVGCVFLVDDVFPGASIGRYVWPLGIIVIGLIIAFKPNFMKMGENRQRWQESPSNATSTETFTQGSAGNSKGNDAFSSHDDVLDATAVFGGVKRSVVSKNFRGGEVVSVFGGAEINLAHADFNGVIRLEIVNVLGGTKLIVPATWDVQSVMVAIFGGVDDKRFINPDLIDHNKRLIIEGTSFLGGLEIKSF
jgi:hypothetical protein